MTKTFYWCITLSLGNVAKSFKESNSALVTYFFGPTGKEKKLTVDKFVEFQQKLQVRWLIFI